MNRRRFLSTSEAIAALKQYPHPLYAGTSNQTRKMASGLACLFRSNYNHGLNFCDTADQYGTHPHAREAMKSFPRDRVVLLSKSRASSAEDMRLTKKSGRGAIGMKISGKTEDCNLHFHRIVGTFSQSVARPVKRWSS